MSQSDLESRPKQRHTTLSVVLGPSFLQMRGFLGFLGHRLPLHYKSRVCISVMPTNCHLVCNLTDSSGMQQCELLTSRNLCIDINGGMLLQNPACVGLYIQRS